ncbi:tripartite tricarboxylate transporter TctB family protein [Ornithinimicrobium cavernae]|uniref:tripartite tricarboxylate transporter TctB family protein n=1 Tax=Ornithinimicrobium cavernae TaxID=2666047 RepID=UPI0013797A71|nr:tripartite tricarboxylate transporter TctB family protein [Ornithinimicrobium cavernae]
MLAKTVDALGCLVLIGLGAWYYSTATQFQDVGDGSTPSAGYYPKILAVALILLAVVALAMVLKRPAPPPLVDSQRVKLAGTVVLTVLFVALWQATGLFYPAVALYVFGSLLLYQASYSPKALLTGVVFAAATAASVYVVFEVLLQIRL